MAGVSSTVYCVAFHVLSLPPPSRAVTNAAASNALKKKAIKKLEVAAKQAAAVSTQCIAAAQGAATSNRNDASQSQLFNHCKAVAEQISRLVQAVRVSMVNADSPSAQLGLINASQAMIPPSGKMVAAAKAAVPTVGDQAAALQLGNFAKATANALAELRAASAKVNLHLSLSLSLWSVCVLPPPYPHATGGRCLRKS